MSCIAAGIHRYLQNECNRRDLWLLRKEDPTFKLFRDALDNRRKQLIAKGVGTVTKQADAVTVEDEEKLWDSGVFNTDSGLGLSYIVYFYNCKLFGFRAKDEHVELTAEQFTFGFEKGVKYLQYSGRLAKNMTGNFDSKATPKIIKQFADPDNSRCIVAIFELYLSLIPQSGRFYRRPMPKNTTSGLLFGSQNVGINKLNSYMHDMFVAANIDLTGRNITGHSGKVTCVTTLYSGNFDESTIKTRSGHRSDAVRAYKRPSLELQQTVSKSLQPPRPKVLSAASTAAKGNIINEQTVIESNIAVLDMIKSDEQVKSPENINVSTCMKCPTTSENVNLISSPIMTCHGSSCQCGGQSILSVPDGLSQGSSGVSPQEPVEENKGLVMETDLANAMIVSVPLSVNTVIVMRNGKKMTLEF